MLCEKPFASNATEAELMRDEAKRTGLSLVEACEKFLVVELTLCSDHYQYHPLAKRMREIIESGELGKMTTV